MILVCDWMASLLLLENFYISKSFFLPLLIPLSILHGFLDEIYDFVGNIVDFWRSIIQLFGSILKAFLLSITYSSCSLVASFLFFENLTSESYISYSICAIRILSIISRHIISLYLMGMIHFWVFRGFEMFSTEKSPLHFIIIIIYTEFFTSALANGFSLEFEWQQISSSLQDSSQYSGRSQ